MKGRCQSNEENNNVLQQRYPQKLVNLDNKLKRTAYISCKMVPYILCTLKLLYMYIYILIEN